MSWQVTGQMPDQIKTDQAGNTTTGVIVRFQTGLGEQSSVFIDDTSYGNVTAVQAALDAKAAIVDQVRQLQSADYQG